MITRKIKQFTLSGNLVNEFESIIQAANFFKVDESSIRKVIDEENKTCKGFKWKSIEQKKSSDYSVSPSARILVFDVETAPNRAYVWGLWKQDVYIDQIISNWFMITWAARFLGEDITYSGKLTCQEAIEQNDKRIVKDLWKLLDEADIVIAHNGDAFDLPRIKTRFLVHGLQPPSPYKQIDTKRIASKEFASNSNKLEALARLLGIDGKIKTDFELWAECMKGNPEALKQMEIYNIQDIDVLEDVYFALRPYIKGHPNLDLYIDSIEPSCPSCSSKNLKLMEGKFFFTQAVRYKAYRCKDCGSICRAKKGDKFINTKKVSAIPR